MQAKNPLTGLTKKQEAFCEAFVRLGDKSKAYREVYSYKNMKDESINSKACLLSNQVNVRARIEFLQKKIAVIAENKFEITHSKILKHLDILRKARIDEYIEYKEITVTDYYKNGKKKGQRTEQRMSFKTFDKLTEEQLMCIESMKQNRHGEIELKLHGKEWTIEKINKHIGFYEKDNEQKNKILTPEDRDERIRKLQEKAMKDGN